MNIQEHFLKLNAEFVSVINETFSSQSASAIATAFLFAEDLLKWEGALGTRYDTSILLSAIQEYQMGCQAAVCGQYRFAFLSLRYFVEQASRFVYLSTNELHFRHWRLGLRDVAWGAIVDKESGILSKTFVRAFQPDLEEDAEPMLAVISKVYRETSEYIHGNFNKIDPTAIGIVFDETSLSKWLQFVESSKLVVLYSLFMRFADDLPEATLRELHETAKEELSSVAGFSGILMRRRLAE